MEVVLQSQRKMTVPKMSQLTSGIAVNIVLKEHQRTGKLTTGEVADILTRGDHPRGIKVRLRSGHVGRVQSLSSTSQGQGLPQSSTSGPDLLSRRANANDRLLAADLGNTSLSTEPNRGRFSMQSDYREDPTPADSRSLADYIKTPRKALRSPRPTTTDDEIPLQSELERDFPSLDTALIAAILADYPGDAEARNVLKSLC